MEMSRRNFVIGSGVALASAAAAASMAGCSSGSTDSSESTSDGGDDTSTASSGPKYTPESPHVRCSYFSFCGQNALFVAQDKGLLEEEGLDEEDVIIDSGADAFSALAAETTDVLLTYSTVTPMNFISNGGEFTMFAGNMAQGGTPLYTKEDTKFDGLEDLVGKKIGMAKNGGGSEGIILHHLLADAGYDPENDFEWVEWANSMEGVEGVNNGELDFSFSQTGYETVREQYGMKDVWYPDDDYPMYSCCRIVARTKWLEENPNTAKALIRAFARAGEYFDDKDYMVQLLMDKLGQDQEKVEGYIKNPHYVVSIDPLKNSILRLWDWAQEYGVLSNPDNINMEDHINTDLYKEVLDDLTAENPDNDYYAHLNELFEEYDM